MSKRTRFAGLGLALVVALAAGGAEAQTYQTLYSFTGGSDGDSPRSGLVIDAAGNIYGTAPGGGDYRVGTLFMVAPDGTFSVLHQFKGGRDGAQPTEAALTLGDHGTLYGLTTFGGVANGGTAWRYRKGRMKVLHSFGVGQDGAEPSSGVLLEPDGSLVGATAAGGSGCSQLHACGTLFRIASDGTETILHNFSGGGSDGDHPSGTPVRDLAGNYYGVTSDGGSGGNGTVYKLAPDGSESIVYSFANAFGGPEQGLAIDKNGNLFGSAWVGNTSNQELFEISPRGREKTVFDLSDLGYGTGVQALLHGSGGSLIGTVSVGGGNQTGNCVFAGGCGALFSITRSNQLSVLHAFGGTDGQDPEGGVVRDASGNYYGTTLEGGTYNHGTIFKITMGTK